MKRFWVLVLFCFFGTAPLLAWTQDLHTTFEEANASYHAGDYTQAIKLYNQLVRKEPRVGVLYFNLGNAYFRENALSEAVLAYKKALQLDPRNSDIRNNLNYTQGLLEYRIEDTRNWYVKAAEGLLEYVTQKEINVIALFFVFIFLLSSLFYFGFHQSLFWDVGRKVLFLLLLLAGFVAFGKYVETNVMRPAIVMEKECEVRYGPSMHDQVAMRLGEGLKVFVVDHRQDWSRVLLVNGESGWVQNSDIAEVKV